MRLSCICLLAAVLCLGFSPAIAAQGGSCEWSNPGHDPYMGDLPSAVDHYTDIPPATRERLKDRMRRLAYDDMVAIRSNTIEGRLFYEPAIRDMHFGEGRTCKEVTRHGWPAEHAERGLVYCEDGFCVLVPFVCRNVSRIRQRPAGAMPMPEAAAAAPPPGLLPAVGLQMAPPPPPPARPMEDLRPGSAMPLSTWLLPTLRPAFPSRIDFPDEPAVAFYPPSGMQPPSPFLPLLPPTPPPEVAPPTTPPEGPRVTPPFPPENPLPPLPPVVPVSPVPEPGTALMLGVGLLVLLARSHITGLRR